MKVAIISFRIYEYGGVERYALELIRNLTTRAEVHLFTNEIKGDTDATVHSITSLGKKALFSVNSFMVFLNKHLRKKDFDIVHSMGPLYLEPDVVTAHICQKRLLWDKETLFKDFSFFKRKYWDVRTHTAAGFQKISFNNAKQVIAVSSLLARELVEYYGIKEPVVIHPGIGREFFKSFLEMEIEDKRKELEIRKDSTVVLFVGGQWERKGLKYLIETLIHLPQDVLLLVVGRGDEDRYKKIAYSKGVGNRVKFAGLTKNIIDYYNISDMLILPSLYEPFGYPVLEAMATGLPVIASTRVGGSELICEGETGYILENTGDVKTIASKVLSIIKRGKKEFSEKAKNRAKEHLWEKKIEDILSVYKKYVSE
jgi:UDP-glucose:(heptosyl)LPS alpha-1,3-glucosyltransferase